MKQYLLIPIEEITNRVKELGHLIKIADDEQALEEFSNKRDECFNLKSKGEIVEIQNIDLNNIERYKPDFVETDSDLIDNLNFNLKNEGYKLIKTIKQ